MATRWLRALPLARCGSGISVSKYAGCADRFDDIVTNTLHASLDPICRTIEGEARKCTYSELFSPFCIDKAIHQPKLALTIIILRINHLPCLKSSKTMSPSRWASLLRYDQLRYVVGVVLIIAAGQCRRSQGCPRVRGLRRSTHQGEDCME